jgi:hypothetical protein
MNWWARHTRKPKPDAAPHLRSRCFGQHLYSFNADLDRLATLEYVNDLNGALMFMKAYVDDDDDLVMETFFEGQYDRATFSILLDNIDYDMHIFFNAAGTQSYFS